MNVQPILRAVSCDERRAPIGQKPSERHSHWRVQQSSGAPNDGNSCQRYALVEASSAQGMAPMPGFPISEWRTLSRCQLER